MNKLKLFSAVLLSCFALSCGGEQAKSVTPPAPKATATAEPKTEVKPLPTIKWHDYNGGEVFKEAEKNSDLLFLVFYSSSCGHCEAYAEISLSNKCVIKESSDGFVFSKIDVETEEGLEAYVAHAGAKPNDKGEVRVAVPTTTIFATIKEVPGFNMRIAKAEGVLDPDVLCKAMKGLREVHRQAIKDVLKKLNENN